MGWGRNVQDIRNDIIDQNRDSYIEELEEAVEWWESKAKRYQELYEEYDRKARPEYYRANSTSSTVIESTKLEGE